MPGVRLARSGQLHSGDPRTTGFSGAGTPPTPAAPANVSAAWVTSGADPLGETPSAATESVCSIPGVSPPGAPGACGIDDAVAGTSTRGACSTSPGVTRPRRPGRHRRHRPSARPRRHAGQRREELAGQPIQRRLVRQPLRQHPPETRRHQPGHPGRGYLITGRYGRSHGTCRPRRRPAPRAHRRSAPRASSTTTPGTTRSRCDRCPCTARTARALLAGQARLVQPDDALPGGPGADQQHLGLAVLHRHLVRRDRRQAAPGQERRAEQADRGRRHAAPGAFPAERGDRFRMGQEERRFLPHLGDQPVEIVRGRRPGQRRESLRSAHCAISP